MWRARRFALVREGDIKVKHMKYLLSKSKHVFLACIAFHLFLIACFSISTKPGGIEPNFFPMEGKKYEIAGKASGESSSFYFLWLIPFTPQHRLEDALRMAMQEKGADNLIDIRWYVERQVWLLGTVYIIHAEGTAVRFTDDTIEEYPPQGKPQKNIIVK